MTEIFSCSSVKPSMSRPSSRPGTGDIALDERGEKERAWHRLSEPTSVGSTATVRGVRAVRGGALAEPRETSLNSGGLLGGADMQDSVARIEGKSSNPQDATRRMCEAETAEPDFSKTLGFGRVQPPMSNRNRIEDNDGQQFLLDVLLELLRDG